VRGDLHRRRLEIAIHHLREQPVQLDRIRRGVAGALEPAAAVVAGRAEQARRTTLVIEDRLQHECGGGLAVRPRDPVEGQIARRLAVEKLRDPCLGEPTVGHQQDRDVERHHGLLHDHGERATSNGILKVARSVFMSPSHGEEQRAWTDGARVRADRLDLQLGIADELRASMRSRICCSLRGRPSVFMTNSDAHDGMAWS
jgi:hypothetical protein